MANQKPSIFEELNTVVSDLQKMFGEEEEEKAPPAKEEEEEREKKVPPREEEEESREEEIEKSLKVLKDGLQALTKGLNNIQLQPSGSKKEIATGKGDEFQPNFKEQDINDQAVEGIAKYDQADKGYGGPNMPPKLLTPKEYEQLYNAIVADGKKGPSIEVVTADAYNSAKSFGSGDDIVDVTSFLKSFDSRLNGVTDALSKVTSMVDKLGEAHVASSKAIGTLMTHVPGKKSVGALSKSHEASTPQINPNQVLPLLEKGVADGELSAIELTKYETSMQLSPAIERYLIAKGGGK